MTEPSYTAHDLEVAELQAKTLEWLEEAAELRFGAGGDPKGPLNYEHIDFTSLASLDEMMRRIRIREERINGLEARALGVKNRAQRGHEAARLAFEIKEAEGMTSAVDRKRDYASARELEAEAFLFSLTERRNLHKAARILSVAQESEQQLRKFSAQLNSWRADLRALFHARQVETSLGR